MGKSNQSKVYALIIGIDKFQYFLKEEGDLNLDGCVRDGKEIENYLKKNIPDPQKRLFIRKLYSPSNKSPTTKVNEAISCASEELFSATRQNIIDGFQHFLSQAQAADTVLVYYSGHGSRETRPKELWHLDAEDNPRHRGQSLICTDTYSWQGDIWVTALRDWEVRWLIAEIAKKNPHILVLTDCCHSSGNTRSAPLDKAIKVKTIPSPKNPTARPIDDYIFYQKAPKIKELIDTKATNFSIPEGRHIAIAAANNYELAKESAFPEGRHGVFTYFLLKILRKTHGRVSYRDLTKLIRANTIQEVAFQTPQYYSTVAEDGDHLFLGGTIAEKERHYMVRPFNQKGKENIKAENELAILDAGSLHGIPNEKEGKTSISVFVPKPKNGTAEEGQWKKGFLSKVMAQESIVQLENGFGFPKDVAFLKAVVTATPVTKTKIYLATEVDEKIIPLPIDAANQLERSLVAGYTLLKKVVQANPFLEIVEQVEFAHFYLFTYYYKGQEKYRISKKDQERALVAPKVGFSIDSAKSVVAEMAHIARWERTLALDNPTPKIIQAGDIELVAIDEKGKELENTNGLITLVHQKSAKSERIPKLKFKVRLNNRAQVPLYCALIHLSPNFGIETSYLPPDAHLGSKSYKDVVKQIEWEKWEIYALSHIKVKNQTHKKGLPFGFVVPDLKFKQGINQVEDHLKLIVSTEQFDARHLYQGSLKNPSGFRNNEKPSVNSALDAVLKKVQTQSKNEEVKAEELVADWWTSLITVRTIREG